MAASTDRRQREIARTREDILEAAARAFARAGYDATTMNDIAREAGYTAASLYTYFRSKQEIFEALFEGLSAEYVRAFDEPLPAGLTFRQKFEVVLYKHLEVLDRRREVFASFFAMQPGPDAVCAGGPGQFHAAFEKRVARLMEWLTANATPEDIGHRPPELVARVLIGIIFALLHGSAEGTQDDRLVDRAPMVTDLFFYGVAGRPASGAQES